MRSQSVGNFINTFNLDSQIANRDEQTQGFNLANQVAQRRLPFTEEIIKSELAQQLSGTTLNQAQANRLNTLLPGERLQQDATLNQTIAGTDLTKANTGLVQVNTQTGLASLPYVGAGLQANLEGQRILNNTNRANMEVARRTIDQRVDQINEELRNKRITNEQANQLLPIVVDQALATAGLTKAQRDSALAVLPGLAKQQQAVLEQTQATTRRQNQIIDRSTKVTVLDDKGNPQVLEMDVDEAVKLRQEELRNLTEIQKEISRVTKENKKEKRDVGNELQQTNKIAADAEISLQATGKKALNPNQRPPVVREFNENSNENYIYIIHPKIATLSGRKIEDELIKSPIPQFTHQQTGEQVQLSAKQIAEYARRHDPPLDIKIWMERVFYPNFRGEKAPWLR